MREAISGDRCPLVATSIDEGSNQWRSVPTRGYFDVVASDLRPVQRDRRHRASDSRSRTNVRTRRSRHDSHQRPSEAIRGHAYQTLSVTMVIRGHQWSSEVIRGHQRSSVVISVPDVIGHNGQASARLQRSGRSCEETRCEHVCRLGRTAARRRRRRRR